MKTVVLVVFGGLGVGGQLSPFTIVSFPNGDCVSNEGIAGKVDILAGGAIPNCLNVEEDILRIESN